MLCGGPQKKNVALTSVINSRFTKDVEGGPRKNIQVFIKQRWHKSTNENDTMKVRNKTKYDKLYECKYKNCIKEQYDRNDDSENKCLCTVY